MSHSKEKEAKQFLEHISEKDSVVVLHHDDLDGFASGMLFYDYCKKKTKNVGHIPFSYSDDQQNVLKQCKKYNTIIITDLGPGAIPEVLQGLGKKKVLYVDHHQKEMEIPKHIVEYRTLDQGYIPCSRTAYELCGGKYWLAVAGTMADMGHKFPENKTFVETFLKKKKISQKKFLEHTVFMINKFMIYFEKKKKKSFAMLHALKEYTDAKKFKTYARPVEKEIQTYIKAYKKNHIKLGDVCYYEVNPRYKVKSTVSTQLGFMHPHDLIVLAHEEEGMIKLSGRTQNKKANVITALKTGIKGLKNANAGGHIPAAGGTFQKKDLEIFKKNIMEYKI